MLWPAVGLILAAALAVIVRRPAVPKFTLVCIGVGLILLALAAAGTNWRRARQGEVVVMVDLSASTRTAAYRDRTTLDRRVRELLGDTPHRTVLFAEENRPDSSAPLVDLPGDRTVFAPPAADVVLLFSDARFEIPATAPRTYIAIDPRLEQPTDATVNKLALRGRELVAEVTATGRARDLSLTGTATTRPILIEPGRMTIARPLKSDATSASAQFSPGDAWPENDALALNVPPDSTNEQWWVGRSAPVGWRAIEPAGLPVESERYLAPAVIVLNNVSATSLPGAQQQRIHQYVRDLGGALVILGGEHAFAAGDYGGTALETLSPLASFPPQPAMQWIVLVDGSGSMSEATTAGTRWQVATSAVAKLLPHLPPEDITMLGSFADKIAWWTTGKSVRETIQLPLPPNDLMPRGPTNLYAALRDVTRAAEGAMPKQLIIVTDADAKLDDAAGLAAEMKAKNLRLHVLAIGSGSGLPALRQIATTTGGTVTAATDAKTWAAALEELGRSAMPKGVETSPLRIQYLPPLKLPERQVQPWNRTWLKSDATPLAEARLGAERMHPPAARWRLGTGEVIAAGFAATPQEAAALAVLIARPPRDPRFTVSWDAGAKLRVAIDAIDDKRYLNGLALTLDLRDESGSLKSHVINQTAPGHYEIELPAPRAPLIAAVRHEGRLLDQFPIAARYAPEFDAIGNDHEAMHELAQRTGGAVIDVRQSTPIDFHWDRRDLPISQWLAIAAALFIAIGLVGWRLIGA